MDRHLISNTSLAPILVILSMLLEPDDFLFSKFSFVLSYLSSAVHPRYLIALDDKLNPLDTSVRVGQAVDVVAQVGRPKTITGFQTHSTPVLLASNERAEIATEEWLSVSSVLEGVVIMEKNPHFDANSKNWFLFLSANCLK